MHMVHAHDKYMQLTTVDMTHHVQVKAIAYPNAKKFKAYDECEQNPFGEGCP